METSKALANPTRKFFVDILTRDISLKWAILDLIDNAIDSFREEKRKMSACMIELVLTEDRFEITDNAGGISVENAEHYAFSFGRKDNSALVPGAIGLYGVGMKRAIFKLGRRFELESKTIDSRFEMDEDVNVWLTDPSPEWSFLIKAVERHVPQKETGTKLIVTNLMPATATTFASRGFEQEIIETAERIYCFLINDGLSISVNNTPLESKRPNISWSDEVQPKVVEKELDGVRLKLVAGVYSEPDENKLDPAEAGWTVLCNDRAVLLADKTELTGWGQSDEFRNPKYHNQYIRFRGVVWISADDSLKLPWDTTKSSLDEDNPFYKSVLFPEMKAALRAVADYLNRLKEEREKLITKDQEVVLELQDALDRAIPISNFEEIQGSREFSVRTLPTMPRVLMKNVMFRKPAAQVTRVMRHYGASSASNLGEGLFDDYVSEYGLDDE